MFLDFLARAYFPHLVLIAIAIPVFSSQPQWPDEEWARTYDATRSKTSDAYMRRWNFDPGTEGRRQAEQEWAMGRQQMAGVDYRLIEGRKPVYAALMPRAMLLMFLTALSYLLTDTLISVGGRLLILSNPDSALTLLVGVVGGSLVLAFVACSDTRLAIVLLTVTNGLALTGLLCALDAFATFEQAHLDVECWDAERRAELRGGAPGARREVQQYYETHRDALGNVFPEALFRSWLNAAIPEGTSAANAWSEAQKLIERIHPIVAAAKEKRRQANDRQQQQRRQLLAEIGSCTAQIARVRTSGMDEDVIADEVEGLQHRVDQLNNELATSSLSEEGIDP